MSVKKILSIIMALAIVLTMASFPAFAAEPVATGITVSNAAYPSPLWGKHTSNGATKSLDKAVDGDATTFFSSDQYNGKNYDLVFVLETAGTLDSLTINWGGAAWGEMAPEAYKVSVAGEDEVFTEILSYEGLYDTTAAAEAYAGYQHVSGSKGGANIKINVTETGLNVANAKYLKITVVKSTNRASIYEIAATVIPGGTTPEEPKPEVKEDTVEALGANIRLATETVSAGLRFGATVNKADLLIEGDYVYDEASDVQLGMYLLPAEMLAESETLEDYIAAGKTEALDVPAKKVYAQDDETITFTAVLVDIPAEAYAKEIVAVPYVKVAEDVTYFEEKDQSYTGVAQAAFDANEAGTVTLTEEQLKALKDILGIEDEPAAATYTVNYVDAEGNAIAVAKNGAGFVGDEVTETAVEVEGYTADKASETITLVDGVNTITFTYTKNEEPAPEEPEEPAGDPVPVAITVSNAAYPSPLWGKHTAQSGKVLSNAVDGDATTYFLSDQYNPTGAFDLVFVLETAGTLDSLTINWGGAGWGSMAPEAYTVSIAGEDEVFTEYLTYTGLYDKDAAAAAYSSYEYVTGSKGNGRLVYNINETGLNIENAKYIKIRIDKCAYRPAIYEIAATVIPN